ncbi:hypothetical protein HZY97_08945 [Sphingomonas sp. R-74633]|uniref:hypothetical protein n=1 Tax=Sphingomonas sp. R-74633 TaxID=2751188 RepID=UPI0015D15E8E|nr:hypothetical protein [Sphingomonas sp. R-74633]NYT40879.1 hypothetical protein [Sphingomonas sp. R-74633]
MKFAILLACVAFAAPAIAQQATPTPEPAAADAKPPVEKKICRMVEQTGSIVLRTRYCLTRAEWAELNQYTSDRADRAMGQRLMGGNRSFGKEP